MSKIHFNWQLFSIPGNASTFQFKEFTLSLFFQKNEMRPYTGWVFNPWAPHCRRIKLISVSRPLTSTLVIKYCKKRNKGRGKHILPHDVVRFWVFRTKGHIHTTKQMNGKANVIFSSSWFQNLSGLNCTSLWFWI